MNFLQAGNPRSASYRRYVLGVLLIVYIINFIDRQILVILQESIKADMGLSDAQLGILTGFSFAIFYVTCGIPIARWSDISNRRNILSASIGLWSAFTALSGMVGNYWQLVAARIGVGIGEAGGTPPAHSLISDYYPPESRARALSIYSMGIYIGILFGFLLGGWIDEYFGWRMAFFVVGLPGLIVALIVRLTIVEPARGGSEGGSHGPPTDTMMQSLKSMWAIRSFRNAALGCAFTTFMGYGMMNFMPSFAVRFYDMPIGEVGTYMALIIGTCGAGGAYAGGWLADRFGGGDRRWFYLVPGIGALVAGPANFVALWIGDASAMWAIFMIATFASGLFLPPVVAMGHELVGPQARALCSAFIYLVLNIIGLGLGPPTVGLISDWLAPSLGSTDSLRWGMSFAAMTGIVSGLYFLVAARTVAADLQRVR